MHKLAAVAACLVLSSQVLAQDAVAPAPAQQEMRTPEQLRTETSPPQFPPTPNTASESVNVVLRNAPDNMEVANQPLGIRVNNREPVALVIKNLSPVEACSITRSPSPTAETNPFQALVSAVSGFGGIAIGSKGSPIIPQTTFIEERVAPLEGQFLELLDNSKQPKAPEPTIDNDVAYQSFQQLWAAFKDGNRTVVGTKLTAERIASEQGDYDSIARSLSTYMSADYRGKKWVNFNPECLTYIAGQDAACADDIKHIQDLIKKPVSAVREVAKNQGNLDILIGWSSYLHKVYEGNDAAGNPRLPNAISRLQEVDRELDVAKALVSALNDGVTALKAAQSALRVAYLAAVKIQEDSLHRMSLEVITVDDPSRSTPAGKIKVTNPTSNYGPPTLIPTSDGIFQRTLLSTDRKATVTGTVVCVSQIDQKTPTAGTINYSILYQDLPPLSLSAGILLTFQQKQIIGITNVTTDQGTTATSKFAITDFARAQVFPMAFLHYHPGRYSTYYLTRWGRTSEERLMTSLQFTGGIGVNPNSGTNQPEFFAGPSLMLNKMVISAGAHFGRVQSLGGGFTLGNTVPSGLSVAPVVYSYHPAFALGFSYRLAPW